LPRRAQDKPHSAGSSYVRGLGVDMGRKVMREIINSPWPVTS